MRGGDAAGDIVARAIAHAGIADLSAVFLDRATPSYTALLDREGDVVAALADMALYEMAFPKQLRRAKVREEIAAADAVLCDANIPAAGLQKLEALADGKPLFAIAISPAKAVRLTEILPALTCLLHEPPRGSGACRHGRGRPRRGGRRQAAGDWPCTRRHHAGQPAGDRVRRALVSLRSTPPAPRKIADVTGAGDALAGAMTVALLNGKPFGEALRDGMAAALLAVESPTSVPELAAKAFAEALALVPDTAQMR